MLRLTEDRLERSILVVYLGHNWGEIFFDKLLMETIKSYYDINVVFIGRSFSTLNDATLREARLIGMDDTAAVTENWMTSFAWKNPVKVFCAPAKSVVLG